MAELVALLTSGKGSWAHVSHLMKSVDWDKIILVTNDFGKEKFTKPSNAEFVIVDFNKPFDQVISSLREEFDMHISSMEVGVNFISGDGKEHMAILAALMGLGVGFRLVVHEEERVKEL